MKHANDRRDPAPDRSTDPRVVLGVSCDFHDAAAALLVDGGLVAAVEEERFSREKHDSSLPRGAMESCLRIAGLTADEVDLVAFYERPLTIVNRYLASRQRIGPRALPAFVRDAPRLLADNLMVGHRIDTALRELGRSRPTDVRYVSHHRSHAAAAFFPSPFDHAAVLTVDGIGEWATAVIGRGSRHGVEIVEELRYPDSLGLLYSFVTRYCGFRPNSDESKVMGLAPYGTPRFLEPLAELAALHPDGSIRVEGSRVGWYVGRPPRRLHRVLGGPPRESGHALTQRDADLAASIQSLCETVMLRMARHAHEVTGEPALCMSGGVALNCVANGRILREGPFDEVWIQPAAGDAGSAAGAALSVWHESLSNPRTTDGRDTMSGAFLGPAVTLDEVDAWVAARDLRTVRAADDDERNRLVAERLAAGDVVGWFSGRMEFGPRSLGHRSILADARSTTVRQRINADVKRREDFRPFGPSVLRERAADWFDLGAAASPYMLLAASVRPAHLVAVEHEPEDLRDRAHLPRSTIPACTHVDGSARIQTVDVDGGALRGLLEAFDALTGCPVLLNTSFNVAGEPIVATPDEALSTARRGGLDLLVVEQHLVEVGEPCDVTVP